jgi:phosphohistidine phosphatase
MRVLIVRHALALPRGTPGVADAERPLTPRGRRRFARAARGLACLVPRPDLLLSSPWLRARQTAEVLAQACGGPAVTLEAALAGQPPGKVEAALQAHRRRELVALVGHEPYLSTLLAWALGTAQTAGLEFRKGGAALLDAPGGRLRGARLVWFLPPRLLRRLG